MSKTLKQCIAEAGDLLSPEDKQLLLSMSDPVAAIDLLNEAINEEISQLTKEIEDAGAEVKKDGRAFTDFFSSITKGAAGLPGISADMKPVVTTVVDQLKDESSPLGKYNAEYNKHKGNFDQHIALSIPGYREFQYQIGNALLNTIDSGTMLDIGASEGTQAKTITSLSNGNIKSVSVDPNVSMQDTFETVSEVPGATFSLTALGMDTESEGTLAWTEDDGTDIFNFDPQGQQYDIVQESMVFQFIDNDRATHINRAASLTKDDGIAIFQEKLFNENWDVNEVQKNKFKALSFPQKEMTEKARSILEGMNENMVAQAELEKQLAANFKYYTQIWDSGNFKGYAASNTFATIEKFVANMGDTSSAFDTRPQGVNVEIAPNPADVEATNQFNLLSADQKAQVTRETAKAMFPKAAEFLGITEHDVTEGTGGFLDETNPSLTVATPGKDASEIGKLLGWMGSQDSIVDYNETKPSENFSVSINTGAGLTLDQQKAIYDKLRAKIPQVEGFSYRDGQMVIGNFSDLPNDKFIDGIKEEIGNSRTPQELDRILEQEFDVLSPVEIGEYNENRNKGAMPQPEINLPDWDTSSLWEKYFYVKDPTGESTGLLRKAYYAEFEKEGWGLLVEDGAGVNLIKFIPIPPSVQMAWFHSDLVKTDTYKGSDKAELQKLKEDFQEEFAVQTMIASRGEILSQSGYPMDKESRLQRARDMGYDTENILWRVDDWTQPMSFDRTNSGAVYLATDEDDIWEFAEMFSKRIEDVKPEEMGFIEQNYSDRFANPKPRPFYIIPGNQVTSKEAIKILRDGGSTVPRPNGTVSSLERHEVRILKEAGVDSVKGPIDGVPGTEVVLINPANIRSINAEFIPEKADSPNILYQSSVALRDGRQTLRKYGLNPGRQYKTREVAAAMAERTRQKSGAIERDDRSDESARKIARWMVQEVKFEMLHPEQSGVGWYSEKYQRAMKIIGSEFPEILTDKNAHDTMTALIAITSDQNKVVANFNFAIAAYKNYRETGKFKNPKGATGSIAGNLKKLGSMYEEMGIEATHEYLLTEMTVSEIKKENSKSVAGYPAHMKLPRSAVLFGPKLGAFYANLMGSEGYLTMDRWWMRSINRYRGTLLAKPTQASIQRFRELIDEPDYTEDQVLIAVIGPTDDYVKRGHWTRLEREVGEKQPKPNTKAGKAWIKDKDPDLVKEHTIEKAANTIYKKAYDELEDSPFNSSDREFMIKAVKMARTSLKRSGIDMSIADIQAVLWYYEKRLYGEMGAKASDDISYEEAARLAMNKSDVTSLPVENEDFQVLNQSAYHGSPVAGIEKMTTEKIGTGEGTQAFGWGLYFAGTREVAEFYRKSLTLNRYDYLADGDVLVEDQKNAAFNILTVAGKYDVLVTKELIKKASDEWARKVHGTHIDDPLFSEDFEDFKSAIDGLLGKNVEMSKPTGGLYQVELAPEPDEYLLLDVGFSQQPQHIQEKLQGLFGRSPEYFDALGYTGLELYEKLVLQIKDSEVYDGKHPKYGPTNERHQKAASEALHAMGIRGNKFLDRGSRGGAGGTYNYVIFHDDDVQVTQQLEQYERGRIVLNDESRTIQLLQASDLSTFLHESGHLFLEMEKVFAKKYGMSDDQKSILKWLGLESFDQITVEHHEKWAETFEVYLREGKAPSLGLRRAFAAFTRWLKVIYRTLKDSRLQRADLDPEITGIFDRLLATQEEIEEAAANPQYDQFFKSREEAGMSPEQWARYNAKAAGISESAEMKVDEMALEAYMKMKTREWKEERAPLIEKARENMQDLPAYRAMASFKVTEDDDGVPFDGRLDMGLLKEAVGDNLSGKFIGKAVKEGGVDPQVAAEHFGYSSVIDMYEDIISRPSLKQLSEEMGQQDMIAKYGDILNDGTLEQEVRESLVNENQAEMLLMEIRALNKENRRPGINREYLKAQAAHLIGGMSYGEIKPDKYYRAMIDNAKKAVTTKDAEQLDAKIGELANHYLYKEAIRVKEKMSKNRVKIKAVQDRKYSTGQVDPDYIHQIKMLGHMYDMRKSPEQLRILTDIISFYHAQQNDSGGELADLSLLDPNLIAAIEYRETHNKTLNGFVMKQFEDLTSEELQGVADMLDHLRFIGGGVAALNGDEAALERMEVIESLRSKGGKDHPQQRGKQKPGESWKRKWNHMVNTMPSLANMVLKMDGGEQGGPMFWKIYQKLSDANDLKFEIGKRYYEEFEEMMGDVSRVGLSRRDSRDYQLENGGTVNLSSEEIFMMALYWGTESSRDAIMQGHGMTENDVMSVLSTLTEDQLHMVNVVWALNESHWPDLARVSVSMMGLAPPKLPPAEFEINGVPMTGGHMQLMYDSQRTELSNEQQSAQSMTSVQPTKAGSLNSRVGSGGQPVKLDIGNITLSIDDKVQYIAFAEVGRDLRRLLHHDNVKAVIERKHGTGFYTALVESIDGVSGGRLGQETHRPLAAVFRWMRTSATLMHLGYSIRNTVQQIGAVPIAMKEVGTKRFIATSAQLLTQRKDMVDFVDGKSKFMENRAQVVNREAREVMKMMITTGPLAHKWEKYKAHAFIFQTFADSLIAYPTWLAAYNKSMETHGNEKQARIEADTSVAQSVGSGSDLHLGRVIQGNQSEGIKTLTMFGSWFNAYFQRLYKSSNGGENFINAAFAIDALVLPFIVANITQALIMDEPDDDESIPEYLGHNTLSFILATMPLVREIDSFVRGFTPAAPIHSLPGAVVRLPGEVNAWLEGRQTGLKTATDVGKVVTGVVKAPGSGQFWRMLDYIDSYIEGKEGDTFNPYQMLTEGSNKDG